MTAPFTCTRCQFRAAGGHDCQDRACNCCFGEPGTGGTNELHVHPLNDLIEHELTEDCTCGPESRPVKREDGSVGWLTVHNSLDGREAQERKDAATGTDA